MNSSEATFTLEEALKELSESILFPLTGILLLIFLVLYLFRSIGLYTIAKRRNIKSPALAWLPFANTWIAGCLSDQYQAKVKGKTTNRRQKLLILNIIKWPLIPVAYVLSLIAFLFVMLLLLGLMISASTDPAAEVLLLISCLIPLILISATLTIFIICIVCKYKVYYDIFSSCNPQKAKLFLVLSIISIVALPIALFVLRNHDDGLPHPAIQEEPAPSVPPVADEAFDSL